ncbi:MAG TPA: hypothetical protein VG674_27120 [Amycolatopsis sp.]|nr:hypothetical protein [Amycolatopsis sp.]
MTKVVTSSAPRTQRSPHVIAAVLAVWGFGYACYRAYYAAGGTFGLIGKPVSASLFQAINALGAAIILVAALLPLIATRVRWLRRTVPVLGWLGGVGCCMHALVDTTLRVLSVTGVQPTELPSSAWQYFDRRAADLQDLLLNEPWFFVEGLLWAALALSLTSPHRRRMWSVTASVACLLLSVVGVLSGIGVIGSFHLG